MTFEPIRIGVIGLGRAFMLTLPALKNDKRVKLVAACAPREESRTAFQSEFGGRTYDNIDDICKDPNIEVLYIATPHQFHAEHVIAAAKSGKHILVDKPLAISMKEGEKMVIACEEANVHLIVGPSHSFDVPVAQAQILINSGEIGKVRMINAMNYTDFLYRPRRPEELKTNEGGGVIFSQAVHQIDIVRLLAGGLGKQVSAMTGNWDSERSTEGAYSALIGFENGVIASLTYSGYAHFDSDEWMNYVSEMGHDKLTNSYGKARKMLQSVNSSQTESALKQNRTFGSSSEIQLPTHQEHFGPIIVSCEHGDIRLTPDGIWVYKNEERHFEPSPEILNPRTPVIDAIISAVRNNAPPIQTGRWGLASLEMCHAILISARDANPVLLHKQISIDKKDQPK